MPYLVPESDVADSKISVKYEDGNYLYYLKLVGVGPKTMEDTGSQPLELISNIPGHLVVGTPEEIREALHDFVDRALDLRNKD